MVLRKVFAVCVRCYTPSRLIVFILLGMLIMSSYFTVRYEMHLGSGIMQRQKNLRKMLALRQTEHEVVSNGHKPAKSDVAKSPNGIVIPLACFHPPMDSNDLTDQNITSDNESETKIHPCQGTDTEPHVQRIYKAVSRFSMCNVTELVRKGDKDIGTGSSFKVRFDVMMSLFHHKKMASDFHLVSCMDKYGGLYRDVHAGIGTAMQHYHKSTDKRDRFRYNVVVIGIGSLSRVGFARNLPLSYKFFMDTLSGVVLEGYNILGTETGSTLLPLLTGKTVEDLPQPSSERPTTSANSYPWIWDMFHQHGYVTQLSLDVENIASFTSNINGFPKKPSDHYLNTFYTAKSKSGLKYQSCEDSKIDTTLRWLKQFFEAYQTTPKFSFTFLQNITTDDDFTYEYLDYKLYETLQWFAETISDNTILLLASDTLYDKNHRSYDNIENFLPFVGLYFPQSFVDAYPIAYNNIQSNSYRLSTPFDVYAMLLNLVTPPIKLGFGDLTWPVINLFNEIPIERTCIHAHIHLDACSCIIRKPIGLQSKFAKGSIKRTMDYLNRLIGPIDRDCSKMNLSSFDEIVRYDRQIRTIHVYPPSSNRSTVYSEPTNTETHVGVRFKTVPGNAFYEVIALYVRSEKKLEFDLKKVFRLNSYGRMSECILSKYYEYRSICYCIT